MDRGKIPKGRTIKFIVLLGQVAFVVAEHCRFSTKTQSQAKRSRLLFLFHLRLDKK